ncbi:amidohydrolase family protein [Hyphobacterium sp.]|uniref:amidohydrolase family protein n=1 Tax=Hyphobacterium sp. TaxID=2004662 RepID=UPI003BA9ED9E
MRSIVSSLLAATAIAGAAGAEITHYVNGHVWNGSGFETRTLAVEDGHFIDVSGTPDSVIDLEGGYVVPAYANAHHHITNPNDAGGWQFLEQGVFYVWNPNLLGRASSDGAREYYARRDTYDVRTSYGGITEPGGHPEPLYTVTLREFVYPNIPIEDFLGDAFHYGRTPAQIDAALDLLAEQQADFVKTYLLYSQEYETRRDDDSYGAERGLNPDNYAYLIEAAHARGLPVAVHVETGHDFEVAARAGVDMFAHIPGHAAQTEVEEIEIRRISPEAAALAAEAGSLAVPTFWLARSVYSYNQVQNPDEAAPEEIRQQMYQLQADNLRTLQDAGVPILTGTDAGYGIFDEIEHMYGTGGMTNAEALTAVFQTGAYLFPDRRIGCFETGCEADFLSLNADPSQDLTALRQISLRIKAGERLEAPAAD